MSNNNQLNFIEMKKIVLSVLALVFTFAVTSCRDTDKKAEDQMDQAVEKVEEAADEAVEAIEETAESVEESIDEAIENEGEETQS